jgi:hypothetical protein
MDFAAFACRLIARLDKLLNLIWVPVTYWSSRVQECGECGLRFNAEIP